MPEGFAAGGLPPLVDGRGRHYRYLRMSVTDRCDLACVYCMPPQGEEDHARRPDLLTFEEHARLGGVFAGMGFSRVRLTGGEPLVRRDIVRLVELVARVPGLEPLVMTTNAMRLAELARPLAAAGLGGVNISLDSLDPDRFAQITRGGRLRQVLAGLHAAVDAGLGVKLNVVLLAGVNDDEAGRLVDFAWERGITPRFIELMPLGEAAKLPAERFLDHRALVHRLGARVAGEMQRGGEAHGPARYLQASDGSDRRVGFITAVSDEFCASCNRVRVSARGELRACLASREGVSLRERMRAGASDAELAWAVHCALGSKSVGHFFNDPRVDAHHRVGMSLIGG